MHFGVLGPLTVRTADGRPVHVPETKVRALLADLLVHRDRPVSVDRLIEDLWGDAPPRTAAGALRVKVSQLRRVLEQAEPGGRALVVSQPSGYLLRVAAEAVDADHFEGLLERARRGGDPREAAALLADALALWRGPAYADFADAQFARTTIARLTDQRLVALEEQADARWDSGDPALSAADLGDLVDAHPLRERLRAAHMRALYRAGRQSEALAGYAELRARLREELGLDPGPELVALHREILEQAPALQPIAVAAPRLRTGNLPAVLNELIGRDEAIPRVRDLLSEHRLVTLHGPGGIGKTRLAIETARGLTDRFPDGVWLIEFGSLDRSATVDGAADAVAAALGVREDAAGGSIPGVDRLVAGLRGRRILLVPDNCEHVIEPVAALVETLLKAGPEVRILATSREPLTVAGEIVWSVPGLGPTDRTETGTGTGTGTGTEVEAERDPAVRLFVARAVAAEAGFRMDDTNLATITAICRRLDGIPLALELAAARVRVLGVDELAARLDDRFRVLIAGRRDAPARQRTLRAMVDWSWELLTEAERIVLRRLAVHVDGCRLAAAERVCAGGGVRADEVLDLLARLVDRSLVRVVDGPRGPRYGLLDTIAAYALERLHESGEYADTRRRHTLHHTAFAEHAAAHLRGPGGREWLELLDAERANIRAALADAARRGDAEHALRLVGAMAWYGFLRGRAGETRRDLTVALAVEGAVAGPARARAATWLTVLVIAAGDEPDPVGRCAATLALFAGGDAAGAERGDPDAGRASPAEAAAAEAAPAAEAAAAAEAAWLLGEALFGLGDLSTGEDLIERAAAAFRALGDRWGSAAAANSRARRALARGDLAAARRGHEHSLALFTELGDDWGRLRAFTGLGTLAEITGDHERAGGLRHEALRLAQDLELWTEVADGLSALGRTALLTGDLAGARDLHTRALRLAAAQGYDAGRQFAEVGLALAARREGRPAEAEGHLRAWLDWCRRRDGEAGLALILAELGFLAEQRADTDGALALHREGLGAARRFGDPRAVALALEGLAGAHALAGRTAYAARLLGRADARRASVGAPLPAAERGDVDRIAAGLGRVLGTTGLDAERARGRAAVGRRGGAGVTAGEPWGGTRGGSRWPAPVPVG